jgi:hypothetical protein
LEPLRYGSAIVVDVVVDVVVEVVTVVNHLQILAALTLRLSMMP